jgi:hypothetical protein
MLISSGAAGHVGTAVMAARPDRGLRVMAIAHDAEAAEA